MSLRNGKHRVTCEDRNEYDGDWVEGKFQGRGTYIWENEEKYEGDWIQEKRQDKGIVTWPNEDKDDRQFVKGNVKWREKVACHWLHVKGAVGQRPSKQHWRFNLRKRRTLRWNMGR